MDAMVDSRQKELNPFEIVTIAIQHMGNDYPMEVVMPAISTELNQPNSRSKKIGNTLFSVLVGKDKLADQGFFKAFNADIPPNFVKNSKEFCVWAKDELGMNLLVTEFQGKEISQLFQIIARNPPLEGMGYTEYETDDGGTRIVLSLGE
jgi:hypothetical protein